MPVVIVKKDNWLEVDKPLGLYNCECPLQCQVILWLVLQPFGLEDYSCSVKIIQGVFPDLKSGPVLEDLIPLNSGAIIYSEGEESHCFIAVIESSNNLISLYHISPERVTGQFLPVLMWEIISMYPDVCLHHLVFWFYMQVLSRCLPIQLLIRLNVI